MSLSPNGPSMPQLFKRFKNDLLDHVIMIGDESVALNNVMMSRGSLIQGKCLIARSVLRPPFRGTAWRRGGFKRSLVLSIKGMHYP